MPLQRSAIAKMERANKLREKLSSAQHSLRERQGQKSTLVGENNAGERNKRTFWAQWAFQPHEPIPDDWPAIIGDILHNLRGALDHAVWDLTCKHLGHEPTRPTQIMFPIVMDAQKLNEGGAKVTLASMEEGPAAALRASQPFQSDAPETHPLAALKCLSDRDKHRSVHVIRSAAYKVHVSIDPMPHDLRQMVKPGLFFEGDVVARIECSRHYGDDVRDVGVGAEVQYGESIKVSDDSPYLPIGDVLQSLRDSVLTVLAVLSPYA